MLPIQCILRQHKYGIMKDITGSPARRSSRRSQSLCGSVRMEAFVDRQGRIGSPAYDRRASGLKYAVKQPGYT